VRLIFAYLNQKEIEKKKVVKDWLPIIPTIREELNKIKDKKVEPLTLEEFAKNINLTANPKFKVGDTVQYKLNEPRTFLGTKNQGNFREGDKRWSVPQTIKNVFIYKGDIPYRYQLNVNPNVSYTEGQLRFYKV
jgi:hypothetical protein